MVSKENILALPHDVWRGLRGEVEAICIFMEDFNNLPDKTDSVEVIRCKNCARYKPYVSWCTFHDVVMKENDYCSYGKTVNGGDSDE